MKQPMKIVAYLWTMRMLFAAACVAVILSGYRYVKDKLDDPPAVLVRSSWKSLGPGATLRDMAEGTTISEGARFSHLSKCQKEALAHYDQWHELKQKPLRDEREEFKENWTTGAEYSWATTHDRGWICASRSAWWNK